jgi:hypothetical protein
VILNGHTMLPPCAPNEDQLSCRNETVALREEIVRSSMFEEIAGSSEGSAQGIGPGFQSGAIATLAIKPWNAGHNLVTTPLQVIDREVPEGGLEPPQYKVPADFESAAYANFATPAKTATSGT